MPRRAGLFARHVRELAAERLGRDRDRDRDRDHSPPPSRSRSPRRRTSGQISAASTSAAVDLKKPVDDRIQAEVQGFEGSGSGWEDDRDRRPRSFPYDVKEACWRKAAVIPGRDPSRWRRDAIGNAVFKKLVGCQGCLCYDYDHIIPYSKGGKSTLDNCQVMQATANRAKGSRTEVSESELLERSAYCRLSRRDMDTVELVSYGNISKVRSEGEFMGCRIS
ncbi:hypothetical protein CBR_g24411 [Chara braunii]|uniref:HNH nuclease domain-containing protein n=1 Tax=Chara braunii TaxID=69332 RepID=A0A388JMP5_CHABU|nr:hypothetical protein CBR_g24411 [Chara braunii]|eukprot:GBG59067.1 hypothetical protein CBR_g24411 [Chara braunii]